MSRISREEVARIAQLARLSLSEDEADAMAADLDTILGYVQKLQALDTEGVEPTAHVLPMATPFRADEPRPSLPPEAALRNAPESQGSAFVVPPVMDGEDEG
ncbi:MAG: Asp-tRNA(Asn)/Glu-tRNA(Gln) amidotransferase subunit GatC [Deltaproteobacteria bacterium]|nr:Asp-tRNA(Asn)/Glu-tRNA(Gln) amidotransferase subunit GatC [Deltaproteobacteria bacterium]MBW2448721.1 Asp-tRNA(Asn)/Glu-tRNA(Gln) amidotransferase subunit GatC [Deltaproteobacteria bacterium]